MKYCSYCKKEHPDGDFSRESKMCMKARNAIARKKIKPKAMIAGRDYIYIPDAQSLL